MVDSRGGGDVDSGAEHVRLGPYPLGWRLSILLTQRGRVGIHDRATVAGPMEAGELVRTSLRESATDWITGVAVGPSGAALVDRQLQVHLGDPEAEGGRSAGSTGVATDGEGRWRVGVPVGTVEKLLVVLGPGSKPEARGEFARPSPAVTGPAVDVGQVVLHPRGRPDRLLASGRVLDQDGAPLQGAWVHAYPLTDGVAGKQDLAWDRTDRHGRYELITRDEVSTGWLVVSASQASHLRAEPIEVALGSPGTDFVLERGGVVSGQLLVDPDVNLELISVRVDGPNRSRGLSLAEFLWQAGGSLRGLEAGNYKLRFEIRGTSWVLLEVGGELDLGPFDLRDKVERLILHLTGEAGGPIANRCFELLDSNGLGARSLRSNANGEKHCSLRAARACSGSAAMTSACGRSARHRTRLNWCCPSSPARRH